MPEEQKGALLQGLEWIRRKKPCTQHTWEGVSWKHVWDKLEEEKEILSTYWVISAHEADISQGFFKILGKVISALRLRFFTSYGCLSPYHLLEIHFFWWIHRDFKHQIIQPFVFILLSRKRYEADQSLCLPILLSHSLRHHGWKAGVSSGWLDGLTTDFCHSQFQRVEVQDLGTGRFGVWWGPVSWFVTSGPHMV